VVQQQLQRYFVALIGFGVVAVWSASGLMSVLACLFAALVCYAAAAIRQRRSAAARIGNGRPVTRAERTGTQPGRPRVVPTAAGQREDAEAERWPRAAEYGW
jgi:hypothetical protein